MESLGVDVLQELGRGTFGTVYKVLQHSDRQVYVLKVISLANMTRTQQLSAQSEVEILRKVEHPHIIRYYNSLLANNYLYILMEYAPGGDLQQLIQTHKSQNKLLAEATVWKIAYELALGLSYLHANQVIHRDVKCMNVLIDAQQRVKIGDLGLSKVIQAEEVNRGKVGSPLFHSPELIRGIPYDFKVDVWALGCVVYYLAALEPPFLGNHPITLGQNIVKKTPPPLPSCYSGTLSEFIAVLLQKDQRQRPSIAEVLKRMPRTVREAYTIPRLPPSRKTIKVLPKPHRDPLSNSSTDKFMRYRLKYKRCVDMAKHTRPASTVNLTVPQSGSSHSLSESSSKERKGSLWLPSHSRKKPTTIRDLANA